MPTEDAYSSGHLVLSHFGICKCSFVETTDTHSYITPPIRGVLPDLTSYRIWLLSLIWHHQFTFLSIIWILTEFDITEYRFPWGICNRYGMPTGDTNSSGHLVLSHFGTCKCSYIETKLNISWTCLVFGLLSFEHPSLLVFRVELLCNQRKILFNLLRITYEGSLPKCT